MVTVLLIVSPQIKAFFPRSWYWTVVLVQFLPLRQQLLSSYPGYFLRTHLPFLWASAGVHGEKASTEGSLYLQPLRASSPPVCSKPASCVCPSNTVFVSVPLYGSLYLFRFGVIWFLWNVSSVTGSSKVTNLHSVFIFLLWWLSVEWCCLQLYIFTEMKPKMNISHINSWILPFKSEFKIFALFKHLKLFSFHSNSINVYFQIRNNMKSY